MVKRLVSVCLFFALSSSAQAQTADALRAEIVAAATNQHPTGNHRVEINGCEMTTYVWRPYEDQGMKLWSSFVFDMRMTNWNAKSGERFMIAIDDRVDGQQDQGMILVAFKMRGDNVARHEVPAFRKHDKKPHRVSPRDGYVPFFYRDTSSFFIMHQGAGVVDKAELFTTAYERYVAEFCSTLS